MSEEDQQRCLDELRQHEEEIDSLARALVQLDHSLSAATHACDDAQRSLARHIAYVKAQVIRHEISVALLQSRLPGASPSPSPQGT